MFSKFSSTKILYISSRVLPYVFRFICSFCVNNGLENNNNNNNNNKIKYMSRNKSQVPDILSSATNEKENLIFEIF